jgi:hypothetical protein
MLAVLATVPFGLWLLLTTLPGSGPLACAADAGPMRGWSVEAASGGSRGDADKALSDARAA